MVHLLHRLYGVDAPGWTRDLPTFKPTHIDYRRLGEDDGMRIYRGRRRSVEVWVGGVIGPGTVGGSARRHVDVF